MVELELPWPPSINHYWRRVGARTLISREGRRFRETVLAILAETSIVPLTEELEMLIVASPPDRRRRDIDNIAKALLDALQHGGVYIDDSQIVDLRIKKADPIKSGRTLVQIFELTGDGHSNDCAARNSAGVRIGHSPEVGKCP